MNSYAIRNFFANITVDSAIDALAAVCTNDASLFILGAACIIGIPFFGK